MVDAGYSGDTPVRVALREIAHDVAGATLRLTQTDAPDGPIGLDLDVRLKDGSRWTHLLLAPPSAGGPAPEARVPLPRGTTAAVYLAGGGPLVAFLQELDPSLAALERDGQHAAADELRAAMARPAACGYALDFDEADHALARARKAPEAERKKTGAALSDAFEGFVFCRVGEPGRSAEALGRKLLAVQPEAHRSLTTVRPAAGLGLPAGSFLVETRPAPTAAPARGAKRSAATRPRQALDDTLVVPDGDTTWLVAAGAHASRAAHLVRQTLGARPTAVTTAFVAPPGTVASAYVTTLFGGFFEDLSAGHLDALGASLAEPTPGRIQVRVSRRDEAAGVTLSLHTDATAKTLDAATPHLALVAVPIGIAILVATAKDDATK